MRNSVTVHLWVTAGSLMLLVLGAVDSAGASEFEVGPLILVTGPTPFPRDCNGAPQPGVEYRNAKVEPYVVVNPLDPQNRIGVWQQDRWSTGGANGLLTGVTFDGGATWSTVMLPFSRCSGGGPNIGGDYERASDPWVTFGPNGHAYQMSLSENKSDNNHAMMAAKSEDGGLTWTEPVALRRDSDVRVFNDKNSMTADPNAADYVYAVWDRLRGRSDAAARFGDENVELRPEELLPLGAEPLGDPDAIPGGPTWFARTTDGGVSWEPAREIYDPGTNNQTIDNQIAVLPDEGPGGEFHGELVNVLLLICRTAETCQDPLWLGRSIAVIRSEDRGTSWSQAVRVSPTESRGVFDPETNAPIRTGGGPDIAVDPRTGSLYIVWEKNFTQSGITGVNVAFSMSTDGGLELVASGADQPGTVCD